MQQADKDRWCYQNALNSRSLNQAASIRRQLLEILVSRSIPLTPAQNPASPDYDANIKKCITRGFFELVAYRDEGGNYVTVKDKQVGVIDCTNRQSWLRMGATGSGATSRGAK